MFFLREEDGKHLFRMFLQDSVSHSERGQRCSRGGRAHLQWKTQSCLWRPAPTIIPIKFLCAATEGSDLLSSTKQKQHSSAYLLLLYQIIIPAGISLYICRQPLDENQPFEAEYKRGSAYTDGQRKCIEVFKIKGSADKNK